MENTEEEGGAKAPLLIRHSIKKRNFPNKIRPLRNWLNRCLSTRFSMKKLFLSAVLTSLLVLGYLVCKSNWVLNYNSYQYSVPRLKPYAACVVQRTKLDSLWKKDEKLFLNETDITTTLRYIMCSTSAEPSGGFDQSILPRLQIILSIRQVCFSDGSGVKAVSE